MCFPHSNVQAELQAALLLHEPAFRVATQRVRDCVFTLLAYFNRALTELVVRFLCIVYVILIFPTGRTLAGVPFAVLTPFHPTPKTTATKISRSLYAHSHLLHTTFVFLLLSDLDGVVV